MQTFANRRNTLTLSRKSKPDICSRSLSFPNSPLDCSIFLLKSISAEADDAKTCQDSHRTSCCKRLRRFSQLVAQGKHGKENSKSGSLGMYTTQASLMSAV